MDYQGIGMLTVIVAFMAIFVYVLMSRSKASNKNANLVPEIEMKEE
jgi:preprotein translocase subunit YajC